MTRKQSLFLALVLALTAFAGLSTSAVAEEGKVITIMCAEPTTLEDVDTNYATNYLEERLGAEFVFNFLPSSEWTTKLEIMVTAGEELSDVLFGTTNELIVSKYGANGTFQDLTPLYEEHSVYIKEAFETDPEYQKLMTFADGKMYSVGRLQQQTHTDFSYKVFLNKVWMENLGIETPETLDDFTEMLRAFVTKDPNGNGEADEIGITGQGTGSYNPFYFIMGSFTFVNTRDWFQVNDGVLNLCYTTDGWKEGLKYLNSLYEEGLIDPLMFTQDVAQLRSAMQKEGDNIVGVAGAMNGSHLFQGNEKMLDYVGTSPFVGPDGTQWAPYQTYTVTHNGFITKDAKDPALAFQLLDLCWEKDASMVIRYGEEEVDWKWADENAKGMFEAAGYPATFELLTGVQSGVQNKWWNVWSPMNLGYDIGNGWADDNDPLNASRLAYDTVALLIDYVPEEVAGKITYTAEESNEIAEMQSNLNSYFKEAMCLFVIGDMDVEADWDEYIEELEALGMNEYLAIAQTAYTRTWGE